MWLSVDVAGVNEVGVDMAGIDVVVSRRGGRQCGRRRYGRR
jgi:hypothetical protein